MSGSSIPTSREERVRSERAKWLGSKASRSAAAPTRSRASPLTFGLSLSARDAVARETPAAAATSASVGRRARFTAGQLTRLAIGFKPPPREERYGIDLIRTQRLVGGSDRRPRRAGTSDRRRGAQSEKRRRAPGDRAGAAAAGGLGGAAA